MKRLVIAALAATMFTGIFVTGCETSHTESDSPTITGGQKHEESTTYKNPITGDTTTEHRSNTSGG